MAKDRFQKLVHRARMRKQGCEDRRQQKGVIDLLAQIERGRQDAEAAAKAKALRDHNKAMGLKLLERRNKEK